GRPDGTRPRDLRDPSARRSDRRRHRRQLPRARDHRLLLLPALPRAGHPRRRADDPARRPAVDRRHALPRPGDRAPEPDGVALVRARDPHLLRRLQDADRPAHPRPADTVGINVYAVRYGSVILSGILAALGGAYLSIGFGGGSFNDNMTAGRGFIALAALIFGNWRPFGTLWAAILFGFSTKLGLLLQTYSQSASTLFQALPYVLTLIAVAGVIGRTVPPAADGKPYVKQ